MVALRSPCEVDGPSKADESSEEAAPRVACAPMQNTENEHVISRTFWDGVWSKDENREFWTRVAPEVVHLIESHPPGSHPDVLDLGCGLGRHAIAFAQAGYRVTATDLSPQAISHVEEWAKELGVQVRTQICRFTDDVFPPESFDIVLSINVIYHGHPDQFAQAIENVRRWLKPRGIFYFTCPSLEDDGYKNGNCIAPHTVELEPGHIHFCADWDELENLLGGLRVISRKKRGHHWEEDGVPQFSSRWQVLVEKD